AQTDKVSSLTSRRRLSEAATRYSLGKLFGKSISDIRLTGFYDEDVRQGGQLTKTTLIKQMGGDVTIDDQEKHCFDAAANGIPAILFGNYNHHLTPYDQLPYGVIHCPTWDDVLA